MSKPAFLALGDIHLNPFIWLKYREITGDAFLGLSSLVDVAVEMYLPLVLVGDIFDSVKPSSGVMRFFRQQMDRCEEENIAVYAIQGNHDKQAVPWYVAAHDHVTHIGDGVPVDIGGLRCVGYDYDLKDRIEQRMVELQQLEDKPQCLFLHQACKEALRFENKWNFDLDWVPEGIPLTVMGDIHVEWVHQIREGQMAYYTGPGSARDIGQRGPKSCLLVNDDLTVERVPIDCRKIEKFSFSAPDQVAALDTWVNEATAVTNTLPPVASVAYTPACAAEVGRILASAEAVQFMTNPVAEPEELEIDLGEDREAVDQLISVESMLAQLIDPEKEPEAFQLVLDLLDDSNSVLDVIRLHREQQQTQEV